MPGVSRRKPRPTTTQSVRMPAPIGGINTVDGAEMPGKDCIYCYNLISSEHGLRSRLGYKEWATGLVGGVDNTVRSVLAFTGSAKNGANDRLFATTALGIYNVSAGGAVGGRLTDFATNGGDAGYGNACVCVTPAGRFLLYCDEENGLFYWSESAAAWAPIVSNPTQLWAQQTNYVVGDKIVNGGNVYLCKVAGKSAAGAGPAGNGVGIVDGTVTWDYAGGAAAGSIGPSLADQHLGYAADPATFCYVTVFKNRVWLVEKNTSRAWYLDVNAILGTATSFDFGSKMRAGGPLVQLVNWSYDAGLGLDTSLVGISGGGDVVIYVGTDPSSAATFGIKGCWTLGAIPYGRRIATDYGGEVLLMSMIGILPLSKLVIAGDTEQKSLYATQKIANVFNQIASANRTRPGWAMYIQPNDNALLVTFPSAVQGGATEQFAMSFATRGWSRYRDLPIVSAAIWNGELYFGTADGRVCRNVDYVDNVLLADPNNFAEVKWSVLSAYQNLDSAREKQVKMLRPIILSNTVVPVAQATAKYDFDLLEPAASAGNPAGGWDYDKWDKAIWGGDFQASLSLGGATGMGRDVAVAVRGSARSRTILVGVDVFFEQGGLL